MLLALFLLAVVPDVQPDDVWAFPYSTAQVEAWHGFASEHTIWVMNQPQQIYGGWRLDAEQRDDAWRHLLYARQSKPDSNDRLNYLRLLRQDIGAADYGMGVMPCPVPLWRFRDATYDRGQP